MKAFAIWLMVIFLAACNNQQNTSSESPGPANGAPSMKLIQTIPLAGVEGRIDHLSVDTQGQRLFVAALGNNTVEILDLKTGNLVHSIRNLSEPQSALFVPGVNRLFVTNGGTGIGQIFDGSSFAEFGRVDLASDADNIRYDENTKSVVVGYGSGGLGFIDAESGKAVSNIKLDGHPESFQLDSSGSKIFVNIPTANEITVVDREQKKVVSTWFMTSGLSNFPMALDEGQHRLFVGFRSPARLGVFDTETGKMVASLDSVGDMDDIFYDAVDKLIFAIGGQGYVDIFSQQDADHYQRLTRIATAAGARTGLWVPEWKRLFVAAPRQANHDAEIQVYELQP